MKTFSILGCGWLGFALAKILQNNYNLNVSTSNQKKHEEFGSFGWNSFIINESNHKNLEEFLQCNFLLIALPPSKFKNLNSFLEKVLTHPSIKQIEKIIFISSTSVYDNKQREFFENSLIEKPSSSLVFSAEKMVKPYCDVILRCAGLMGYDRVAGKYFSGKEVVDKNNPVNYVHRDDVVRAVIFSIKKDLTGIYNLCACLHPTKEEVYEHNSLKYNFKTPLFIQNKETFNRIINAQKIEKIGFKFLYKNPLEFN